MHNPKKKKKKKNEHDYNSWHENKRPGEKEIVTRRTERNKHALPAGIVIIALGTGHSPGYHIPSH